MTPPTNNIPNGDAPAGDEYPQREPRRRRPAPPAHPFFRFGFPVLVLVAGLAVFLLWRDGAKAVLDTTDGEDVSAVDDPAEPGFLAFATPTPTLLVAHVDGADNLVGVTVLARTAADGGSLVVFSRDMFLDVTEPVVMRELYATEGIEGLASAVGEWMGFGFTDDLMIMSTERLATFLVLVEPISFSLADPLVRIDDDGVETVVYESGFGQFTGEQLAQIYEWRNPTERDDGRFLRQEAIWRAWLVAVGQADDLLAATFPFPEGLPPYLRAFGTGTVDIEVVPAAPVDFNDEDPLYALAAGQESWPIEKGRKMVPVPVGWAAGVWPTVQLLDGTGDGVNRGRFLPAVVAAGAEIAVVGNALSFDVTETFLAYHDAADADRAEEVANSLGIPVVFEEDLDQPAELTVTVGLDSADVLASLSE